MKITVRKAVEDIGKIVPHIKDLWPFQHLKTMASTVAIGNQGIEVDGLMKDYEAYIMEEMDKNSPSELDIDPNTHPSYTKGTVVVDQEHPKYLGLQLLPTYPNCTSLEPGTLVKVTQEEFTEIKKNPDKLVDALRKKLQEK